MPKILRIIAVIESLAGVLLLLVAWFGEDRSFLLGVLLLVSALISAAVFLALAQILENSEAVRAELGSLRDDLQRELKALRQGGPAPSRSPSPPPPRPSTAPIRESTDPITGRVT